MDLLDLYIKETVRKCGSQYCLYSSKGKVFGKHSSKKKAYEQEYAIKKSEERSKSE